MNKRLQSKKAHEFIFVSGPSRSGKSRWAEHLMSGYKEVIYIATSQVSQSDDDWIKRIQKHRERRPKQWLVLENGDNLEKTLFDIPQSSNILIDSLGGYITRHLDKDNEEWDDITERLITTISEIKSRVILVSEECGWDVVPGTEIGYRFRERICNLSQQFQEISTQSWLVINGRAIDINSIGLDVP